MTLTYVQDGKVLDVAAPRNVSSGDGVLVGGQFGVAKLTALSGATVPIMTEDVHLLPKTSAQAWTDGQDIFWDDGNHRADSSGAVGPHIGTAHGAAANPSATGVVKLRGCSAPQAAFVAQNATANATDLATSEALANSLKTDLNSVKTALINAGIMKPS